MQIVIEDRFPLRVLFLIQKNFIQRLLQKPLFYLHIIIRVSNNDLDAYYTKYLSNFVKSPNLDYNVQIYKTSIIRIITLLIKYNTLKKLNILLSSCIQDLQTNTMNFDLDPK